MSPSRYVELQCASHFSFLRGASSAEELFQQAANRHAVRLGLRMVRGLNNVCAAALLAARGAQDFASIDDLWRRAGIPATNLVTLAEADAFLPAFGMARREALWAIKPLRDEPLPLFAAANRSEQIEPPVALHPLSAGGEVIEDYDHVGLTLRRHPLAFLREELRAKRIVPCAALREAKDGSNITVAGLVLMRQRPGTAKGVVFFTLEDETGTANAVVWSQVFERQRRVAITSRLLAVRGYVQREGDVVHLIARSLEDLSQSLTQIGDGETIALRSRDFR